VEEFFDAFAVGFNADGAVVVEGLGGVAEKANGLQDVVHDDGLKDVELEVSGCAGDVDGYVVSDDLRRDHGDCFALGGVYFSGHD